MDYSNASDSSFRISLDEWRRAKAKEKAARAALIPNWGQLRKMVIERDDFVCRICGADPCEAPLHVHHVDWDRTNNRLRNLVTLCPSCHTAIHAHNYRPDGSDDKEPWGNRGSRDD